MWRALGFLACVAGCIPPEHGLAGRPCDGLNPCPVPYICQANACTTDLDAGTLNLAVNPGFEARVATSWSPFNSQSLLEDAADPIRSGVNAAKVSLTTGSPAALFGMTGRISESPVDGWFCARAWVARGTNVNPIYFQLATRLLDGGTFFSAADAGTVQLPPADGGWFPVTTRLFVQAALDMNPRVLTQRGPNEGFFFVDDVAVWLDPDGRCESSP